MMVVIMSRSENSVGPITQDAHAHSTVQNDVNRLDHVEFGNRPADFGVENSGKGGLNRIRARMGHMSIVRSVAYARVRCTPATT